LWHSTLKNGEVKFNLNPKYSLTKDEIEFLALLKPSKHIEYPLMFQEPINGENNTLQFDLFHLLSI